MEHETDVRADRILNFNLHGRGDMENRKQCPYCAEIVENKAVICKHCQSILGGGAIEKAGEHVRVRVKTYEKIYSGDIFVPQHLDRVSDVINDGRHFIILTNSREEAKTGDVPLGFLAVNKAIVEWVRLIGTGQE